MKTEHALRHLFLRHFNMVRTQVPQDFYTRVSESLNVQTNKENYTVSWDDGQSHTKVFSKDAFKFYERGDTNPETRSLTDSLSNQNQQQARAFTQEVFGRTLNFDPAIDKAWDPGDVLDMVCDVIFLVLVVTLAQVSWKEAAMLLPLFYLEYTDGGRVFVAFYLGLLVMTRWAGGVLVAAPVFMVLQFLDPSSYFRKLRVMMGLIVFLGALTFRHLSFHSGLWFWMALAAAVVLLISRILFSCNHHSVRLMWPFFCAGLAGVGLLKMAMAGLCYAAVHWWLHAYGFKYFPVLNRTK